ncbi:MAG: hypothetical protein AAB592_04750 [Patescibacteria group bacterium]
MADQFTPPPQTGGTPVPPQPIQPAQTAQGAGMPMTGGQPAGAQPPAPQTGQAPAAPKPPSPPANFQLGILLPPQLKVKVPAHTLKFDEQYFLRLLAGSISLTKIEKRRIVDSIPKLKQEQIDELVRIFEEERKKFAELGQEHVPQLEKLAKQHYEDWMDIEMEEQQQSKKQDETNKAEELRKKLGL